jgi:Riboflavin synthase alpha chain
LEEECGRLNEVFFHYIRTRTPNAVWYTIPTRDGILRYIIKKGSVAVDGISPTVTEVDADRFNVSVIPHTTENTTLSTRSVGDSVNLESDVVGKYIEKLTGRAPEPKVPGGLTKEKLMKLGY